MRRSVWAKRWGGAEPARLAGVAVISWAATLGAGEPLPAAGPTATAAGAPAWIPDPANSRWIDLGRPVIEHGLHFLPATSEGTVQPCQRGGRPGHEVVPTPPDKGRSTGARFWYFHVGPWKAWAEWIADHDVDLTFVYWDGRPGLVRFSYDSADPRVRRVAQHPGAWRVPEELADGLRLTGAGKWLTRRVALPLALFQKRCNGADWRFEVGSADSDFALAGVALTRVPRRPAASQPADVIRVPVRFLTAEGLSAEGRRLRLPRQSLQQADQPIVLEAEQAVRLHTEDRGGVGLDPTASGGAYIHFVLSAQWEFTVSTAGRYRSWQRARFPHGGHWNHGENLDTQPTRAVTDNTNGPHQVWLWVKGPVYDLTVGRHRLQTNYHAGAQLDQIVLSRDLEQAPTAPLAASPTVGPERGWAESVEVRPLDVAGWERLEFQALGPADGRRVALSADGGRTWQALPADGDLRAWKTEGGGRDRLRLRVELSGSAGAPSPVFQEAVLAYRPGPHNQVVLDNAHLSLTFDALGLVAGINKRSGHAFVHHGRAALLELGLKRPGEAPLESFSTAAAVLERHERLDQAAARRLTLGYRFAHDIRAMVEVELSPDGRSIWTLRLDNPSPLEVAEVNFPVLGGVCLGTSAADDTLFIPQCWGQVIPQPALQERGRGMLGPGMRWMDLWDATDGLYLGLHDTQWHDTGLYYRPDGPGTLQLTVHQRILVRPGAQWTSDPRVVYAHGGDWHEGADLYREYAARVIERCDTHEWVRWIDGWGTQLSNLLSHTGWGVLRVSAEAQLKDDFVLMAANRQMLDGCDSGYCGLYPYPCLAWGSVREFSQQLMALRRQGLFYTPYMNWRLWAPGYGHLPRVGTTAWKRLPADAPRRDDAWFRKIVCYEYDGSCWDLLEDPFAQVGVSVGAPEWQERLRYWTLRYIDWNADGMYYDQFGMNYASGRLYPGYETYGFWTRASLDTLRRAKDEARKKNPYYCSSGEVYHDVLGQAVDLHMTSGVVNRLEFFLYCLPHHLIIDGGWNGGLGPAFGGHERERFIWQVGARFEQLIGPEPWRTPLLTLRRAVKSLLYRSAFQDTVGLEMTDAQGSRLGPEYRPAPGVQHAPFRGVIGRWFLLDQGEERAAVVNFINTPLRTDAVCTIQTDRFGPVRAAWAYTLEGRLVPVAGRQEGRAYRFPVPASELSSVVLVNRAAPLVRWRLARTTTGGQTVPLRLEVDNLGPRPAAFQARLLPPKGWPSTTAASPEVSPGGTATLALPVTVPAEAPLGRHDVRAEVTGPDGSFTTYSMLVVAEPVIAEFRGDPGSYELWLANLSSHEAAGRLEVQAPPPLAVSVQRPDWSLKPGEEACVSVQVTGRDRLREIAEMSATITGPVRYELVRAVLPIVPNGDFEIDSAGDRKPDWWMCRRLADRWSYERLRLDEGAASGRWCVRLDPPDGPEDFTRAYNVHGLFQPDIRYRVSVQIKAADPTPGKVYVQIGGLGHIQLRPKDPAPDRWQRVEVVARSPKGKTDSAVSLINRSRGPAWFDALEVEELKD